LWGHAGAVGVGSVESYASQSLKNIYSYMREASNSSELIPLVTACIHGFEVRCSKRMKFSALRFLDHSVLWCNDLYYYRDLVVFR
jgi:hypothetical protein